MCQICRNVAGVDRQSQGRCVLPSPEKLAKEGKFLEAAKLYEEQALQTKDVHKKRRFLNFAGRCYESAAEFSLSVKSFLESGDVDRALGSAVKSGNPKVLSKALAETGHKAEETVELLLRSALQLTERREFAVARAFAKEASDLKRSQLTEAMTNMIDGILEGKAERVASCVNSTRFQRENDPLAREINFVANKFLVSMPKGESGTKEPPTRCPECGAPLPQKAKGKFIECAYCGFPVRLD